MAISVIMLNGGSSSGKSTIARCLQSVMPDPWLTFSVDDLMAAMPASLLATGGVEIRPDGRVVVGPQYRQLEAAWMQGIAAMARAGGRVIIDEVLLNGGQGQQRWSAALTGLGVLWAGIRCDPDVAAAREACRGDRVAGMARLQAHAVHEGMRYDVEADSSAATAAQCAAVIAAHAR
ncbi:MAG TPA: chloramphenicol phosphotransferase [Streptosporangiaceae bacterium]